MIAGFYKNWGILARYSVFLPKKGYTFCKRCATIVLLQRSDSLVLIKLAVVVILMLVMIAKKCSLPLSMVAATVLLLLVNGRGPSDFFSVIRAVVMDPVTVVMTLTIMFISIMGYLMGKYQILNKMTHHFEIILRSTKLTMFLCPPLVGLLLVTGGALMSCPMVDSLGERLNMTKPRRAACNLIFRHGIYFVYPLSSTLILAAQIGKFDIMDLIVLQIPVAIVAMGMGYFYMLRGVPDTPREPINTKEYLSHLGKFLIYSLPITSTIFLTAAFGIPFHFSLPLGIAAAIVIHKLEKDSKPSEESTLRLIMQGANPEMVVVIWSILLFKAAIDNISEITTVAGQLVADGMPLELLIIMFSLISAYALGNYQPAIAILIPIIAPIAAGYNQLLLYTYLIYGVSFIAYFVSPAHMCQVLTGQYFKVSIGEFYSEYKHFYPVIATFILVWYLILKFLIIRV